MFHKIKDVRALSGCRLCVAFAEGITKIYDVSKVCNEIPTFEKLLTNEELFCEVSVDVGGYGVIWDDYYDLSCDELWTNGIQIKTPFDRLLALSDATVLWGLNESTLRKAIAYGKLTVGIDVSKFGKQWIISMDAMEREYGKPGDLHSL